MIKLRAILRRRYLVLAAATLLGLVAGAVSSLNAPSSDDVSYVAEQVVVVNRSASQNANVAQDALKVTRGAVPAAVAKDLPALGNAEQLAGRVTAEASPETNTISVMAKSKNPAEAKLVVGKFVERFVEVINAELQKDEQRRIDELQQRADVAQQAVDAFDAANPAATAGDALGSADPQIRALVVQRSQLTQAFDQAQGDLLQSRLTTSQDAPYSALGSPSSSVAATGLLAVPASPYLRGGLMGTLGLLLGVGLVMIIERANPRIDTRDELAEAIDAPILAEVGRIRKRKVPLHTDGRLRLEGVWAEPYRRVRSAIQFVQMHAPQASAANGVASNGSTGAAGSSPRVFLVTSAQPSEGKSTTVALTALALAEGGVPTLVVGGDFRKPRIESLLGSPTQPSLQDRAVLSVDRPSIDAVVHQTADPNLWVAPSGPSTREVTQLVQAAREVITEGAARGATVIVDSSPLQAANDTVDLLDVIDQVILVVRSGEATAAGLRDSVELLNRQGGHLLGVVLVGTPGVAQLQSYYYGYYSGAGSAASSTAVAGEPATADL